MKDNRIVYGVGCVWWDNIDKVAKTESGLPCCPYCGSVLFEMENEAAFLSGVPETEKQYPGYGEYVKWQRGKCLKTFKEAWDTWLSAQPNPSVRP